MAVEPKKVTGGAFGRFLAENRPAITKECAGKPVTAVVKLASERFKALSASENARYQAAYEKAKKQYEVDMAAFLAAGGEKKAIKRKGDKLEKKGKKAKKFKDADAPKRPAGGAFGCYLTKHRAAFVKECAGQPITAVTKLAGERWKALSAEEKKPFEADYEIKKAAYETAMKSYVPPARDEEEEAPKTNKEIRMEEKEAAKAAKEQAKQDKQDAKDAAKQAKEDAKKGKKGKLLKATARKSVAAKTKEPAGPELLPSVAAKAEKAGLTEVLLKLANRPDIKETGVSQKDMLTALEENGGLLHPAKRALLGC